MSNKSKTRKKILEKLAYSNVAPDAPVPMTTPMPIKPNVGKISMSEAIRILEDITDEVCDEIMNEIDNAS
jgi:hypothetical protein